jgi:hypothetical protein
VGSNNPDTIWSNCLLLPCEISVCQKYSCDASIAYVKNTYLSAIVTPYGSNVLAMCNALTVMDDLCNESRVLPSKMES